MVQFDTTDQAISEFKTAAGGVPETDFQYKDVGDSEKNTLFWNFWKDREEFQKIPTVYAGAQGWTCAMLLEWGTQSIEHVVPKSHMLYNDYLGREETIKKQNGSTLNPMNFLPSHRDVNSMRGNRLFDFDNDPIVKVARDRRAGPKMIPFPLTGVDNEGEWVVPTRARGDVARCVLYMVATYGLTKILGSTDDERVDALWTLREWASEDPPSAFEKAFQAWVKGKDEIRTLLKLPEGVGCPQNPFVTRFEDFVNCEENFGLLFGLPVAKEGEVDEEEKASSSTTTAPSSASPTTTTEDDDEEDTSSPLLVGGIAADGFAHAEEQEVDMTKSSAAGGGHGGGGDKNNNKAHDEKHQHHHHRRKKPAPHFRSKKQKVWIHAVRLLGYTGQVAVTLRRTGDISVQHTFDDVWVSTSLTIEHYSKPSRGGGGDGKNKNEQQQPPLQTVIASQRVSPSSSDAVAKTPLHFKAGQNLLKLPDLMMLQTIPLRPDLKFAKWALHLHAYGKERQMLPLWGMNMEIV